MCVCLCADSGDLCDNQLDTDAEEVIHPGANQLPKLATSLKPRVFRKSLVSMLVSSCDHKEKKVVNNIFEVIKVHIIVSFEAISFKVAEHSFQEPMPNSP